MKKGVRVPNLFGTRTLFTFHGTAVQSQGTHVLFFLVVSCRHCLSRMLSILFSFSFLLPKNAAYDILKEKPPVKTVLEVRHAEAKLESKHRLHIRAPAGVPAPDLALRAHHRGRADGLWQDDGGELVSFRARQARRSRRCAYQRVFGQSGHLLEERAGGLFPRGARLSARLPLPRRRRGRKPPDGRSLPRARGQAALLYFHRRLSPLDRQPRARLSLHADEPPA